MPLAYDRASESKVGVFYTKLGERSGNNDHVIVRLLNKNKQGGNAELGLMHVALCIIMHHTSLCSALYTMHFRSNAL